MGKSGCGGTKPRTDKEREAHFWSKVQIGASNECWEWQGYLASNGYGEFAYYQKPPRPKAKKSTGAHRVAYAYANKLSQLPARSVVIMHTCDNRRCCNPKHLRIGTTQDNTRDMIQKRRHVHGERCHTCKITEADVRLIRASRQRGSRWLAETYRVDPQTIRDIWRRKSWKHVE